MKIPALTAERGIGRPLSVYAAGQVPAAVASGASRGDAVVPMLLNVAPDGSMPCPSYTQIPCRGGQSTLMGTDFRGNYVCCDPNTHGCSRQQDGTPWCRALPPSQMNQAPFQSP